MGLKSLFLLLLFLVVTGSIKAQRCPQSIVSTKHEALINVPVEYRSALVERLNCYIQYLEANDLDKLYDFATNRTRQGLSKEDFVRSARVSTEGRIKSFKIQRAVMAGDEDYVDEPKPSPGEGDKWFVSGCAKVRINGRARRYGMGFDVWLTQGQWYMNRGGLSLAMYGGGYRECES